jgi:hypothetical protein
MKIFYIPQNLTIKIYKIQIDISNLTQFQKFFFLIFTFFLTLYFLFLLKLCRVNF